MNSSSQEALNVARAQLAAVVARYQQIDAQRTRAAEALARRDEITRLRQGAEDQLRAAGEKYSKALDQIATVWAEVLSAGVAMEPFANPRAGRVPLVSVMTPRRIEVIGLFGAGPDLDPNRTFRDVGWSDVLARAAQLRAQIGAL